MDIMKKKCTFFGQLILLGAILIPQVTFAAKSDCQIKIEKLFLSRNKKFFNYQDRFYRGLDLSFLNDESLTSQVKAKKLFDLYLDRITDSLTQAQANELRKLVRETEYLRNSDTHNGSYSFATERSSGEIRVYSLKSFSDSFLTYSTLAHETEHALKQILAKTKNISPTDYKKTFYENDYERSNFLDEMGAISAEWLYLSAVPQKELDDLRIKVEQIKRKIDPNEYKLILTSLEANQYQLIDYLKLNWKNKRYDYATFKQNRLDDDLNRGHSSDISFFTVLLSTGTMATYGLYELYNWLSNDENEDTVDE